MNTPKQICENYIEIGKVKVNAPVIHIFLLAIMAGMFIAFGGIASTVAGFSVSKFIGACVFPGGLAMVLLAGSELFTGNCLLIIPLLTKQISTKKMLANLTIVYIGNFIGSIIIAAFVVYGHSLSILDGLATAAVNTAVAKCSLSFEDAIIRGILCNFLVCIAVWISFAAKDVVGKISGLFFPIMIFVLCGFEHCVANMYFISAGIFASMEYALAANITWFSFLFSNLLPVTIGNIIGGMVFVGCIYWKAYGKHK